MTARFAAVLWMAASLSSEAPCTGTAGNLGNAQVQGTLPDLLVLPGGHNHAGVGHGDPNASDNFGEGIVIDPIIESVRVDIICMPDPGNTDGMRANSMGSLQMLRVH